MADATLLYQDGWGTLIDFPAADFLEIRWYDTTDEMTGPDFNSWLERFAAEAERRRRRGLFVDAVQFKMDHARMDEKWRQANIVPRYNAAGVKKFAFQMPDGMPLIGSEPKTYGIDEYLTAYFARRQEALEWLARF